MNTTEINPAHVVNHTQLLTLKPKYILMNVICHPGNSIPGHYEQKIKTLYYATITVGTVTDCTSLSIWYDYKGLSNKYK